MSKHWILITWEPKMEFVKTVPYDHSDTDRFGLPEDNDDYHLGEITYDTETGVLEWVPPMGPNPIYTRTIGSGLNPETLWTDEVRGHFSKWLNATF